MGSVISPVLADLVMEEIDQAAVFPLPIPRNGGSVMLATVTLV